MKKSEFLAVLREKLGGVPENEIRKSVAFYGEMIDDRIEDGTEEEEAVASMGNIDEIVKQIQSELPLKTILKNKVNHKRFDTMTIILLILGFPLWFPLLFSLICIVFTVYLCIWIFDVAMWSIVVAFGAVFIGGLLSTVVTLLHGMAGDALYYFGSALAGAGLCIFSFFGVLYLTKGILHLTALLMRRIKIMIIGKKEAA